MLRGGVRSGSGLRSSPVGWLFMALRNLDGKRRVLRSDLVDVSKLTSAGLLVCAGVVAACGRRGSWGSGVALLGSGVALLGSGVALLGTGGTGGVIHGARERIGSPLGCSRLLLGVLCHRNGSEPGENYRLQTCFILENSDGDLRMISFLLNEFHVSDKRRKKRQSN